MDSDGTTEKTIYYNSAFIHGVDEKRRVQIPSRWRPTEPNTELTLILWPKSQYGPCLRVLPPRGMAALLNDLNAIDNANPRKENLKRLIGRDSAQAEMDKAGRICIPAGLATAAGITDQAVLVGLLDKFEIWNPERYKKVSIADEVLANEAFRMME